MIQIPSNAQADYPVAHHYEPISTDEKKEDRIYIQANMVDSLGIINVLMINKSSNPITLSGFHKCLDFRVQAKINGEWKNQSIFNTCASGYGQFILPAHTYTWKKANMSNYVGDYETVIRFYTQANDSFIISKNVNVTIDTTFFLSEYEMVLSKVNKRLKDESKLSKKERLSALTMKAELLMSLNRTDEAIKAFETIIEQYPAHYEAYYEYGLTLLKHISTIEKANKNTREAHLRKALSLFEAIPRSSEYYKRAKKKSEVILNELEKTKK